MLYGETLRLPGEMVVSSSLHPQVSGDLNDFVTRLRHHMEGIRPVPASRHGNKTSFVFKNLNSASHVYLREDAVCRPLQPPYSGPYQVVKRATDGKTITISVKGKNVTVSVDRIKPAFILQDPMSTATTTNKLTKAASELPCPKDEKTPGETTDQQTPAPAHSFTPPPYTTRSDGTVKIRGVNLNIIYDPCHLIKGLRNNFITKNILMDGRTSKWSDIVDVYKTDCSHAEVRLLHKLNDEHVIPEKIKKMKVKNCVKVLSSTMSAALSYTAKFSHYADGRPVSETLDNTAKTVLFLDQLFDSINGASIILKFHNETFNCEDDPADQVLNLQTLFDDRDIMPGHPSIDMILEQARREKINVHSRAYTAGWVVRKDHTMDLSKYTTPKLPSTLQILEDLADINILTEQSTGVAPAEDDFTKMRPYVIRTFYN
ncbi:hypothetical protein evm_005514 [Chilo suppressalis]|nr:hypothetical protein evm_005514 [Chilo suppressalis]